MTTDTQRLKYVPALDGVRGIAILIVILFHIDILYWGWLGVQLFFVLSGFLITNGLMENKDQPFGSYLKVFYIKRTLRIFPLYFTFLFILVVTSIWYENLWLVGKDWPYMFSYTYNIHRTMDGYQHSPFYGHLWSLSVEEQFYIVWPFFIYFIGNQYIKKFIISIIVIYGITKLLSFFAVDFGALSQQTVTSQLYFQTFWQADAFAYGALGALLYRSHVRVSKNMLWLVLVLSFFIALGLEIIGGSNIVSAFRLLSSPAMFDSEITYAIGYTITNIIFLILILYASQPADKTILTAALSNKYLVYVGKISYGLYIIHYPILGILEHGLSSSDALTKMIIAVLCIVLTGIIASLSYKYFESPILALKSRYY